MDLASAKVIGAGLAAIGVGAAAAGVGIVFGSFLQGALRNPAAADGQQGRLFIGFAAAELLGLMAFAVAMIILYADLSEIGGGARPAAERCNATTQPACRCRLSQLFWLLLVLGLIYFVIGRGDGAEDPGDRRPARPEDRRRPCRRRAGPGRGRRDRGGVIGSGWTKAAPRR